MRIFEFNDYKMYVNERIKNLPNEGRGEYFKIAKILNIHPSLVCHIFKKDKNLTMEQGAQLCEYLKLTSLDEDYFMTLIMLARAGNVSLKRYYQKKLQLIKKDASTIGKRLNAKKVLKDKDKAIYYSAWHYNAIRLLTSVGKFQKEEAIISKLNLPRKTVEQSINFLLAHGLIRREREKFVMGDSHIHVDRDSPFVTNHHRNWRLKNFERHTNLKDNELIFTAPLTISEEGFDKVKEKILQLIEDVKREVNSNEPEKLACLNIDWLEVT